MTLEDYRSRIIEQMLQAEWWLLPMPAEHDEQEIWWGRAALLDTIYYAPPK